MSRNGRHSEDKIALVLAGGGMTGAVYEIGALRAIDDLLVDRSVNDFDIYVGTSAGAIVASFIANGITPADMYRAIAGEHPDLPALRREHIFSFNYREVGPPRHRVSVKLVAALGDYLIDRRNSTLVDTLWSLTDVLPSGPLRRPGAGTLHAGGAGAGGTSRTTSTRWRRSCTSSPPTSHRARRAVFGPEDGRNCPISQAVAASTALPIVYKPVSSRAVSTSTADWAERPAWTSPSSRAQRSSCA